VRESTVSGDIMRVGLRHRGCLRVPQ